MATTGGQHSARLVVSFAPPPATSNPPTQSASGWHNLTAWAVNRTRSVPFLHELVGAGPRMLKRFGVLMALTEATDGSDQLYESATTRSGFLEPIVTDPNIINVLQPKPLEPSVNAATSIPPTASDQSLPTASRLALDGPRGLGSVFSYAVSKWALACVAMAILLNRTHVFAATRRRLRLGWDTRLLLRLPPILLLGIQVYWLLESIQCQTSSEFARLRWGDAQKNSALVFAYPSAILNRLTSTLLFGSTDEQSCINVGMTPPEDFSAHRPLRGSLSLLWPLFGTFCLSHFLETVSCAIQGRPTAAETGMTLFEQSLAFAEAEAAIGHQLNWKSLSGPQKVASSTSMGLGNANTLTRSLLMKRVNTAPGVLLVALLSTFTHITSHLLGVFDLQAKYRLLNTGFWGICFMASIVWSISLFDLETASAQGLMRFPTVCIIGFVPHVLVVIGIVLCASIYGLALLLSTLALPSDQYRSNLTWRQRLSHARSNMQANLTFADIRVTRDMDFYTALLRVGFAAISLASEAVYLHEDREVFLRSHTWLEQARFREMEELQRQSVGIGPSNTRLDQGGTIGLIPIQGETLTARSGYARERAAQQVPKGFRGQRLRVGTGATERSSRWLMAIDFLLSIGKLSRRVAILSLAGLLSTLRIRSRPAWLFRRGKSADGERKTLGGQARPQLSQQFSAYGQDVTIPHVDDIDVETVFRQAGRQKDEQSLDKELYQYWAQGEWWGSKDLSGDFQPQEKDWDTTSLISTAASDIDDMQRADDDDWESEDDGQRTPRVMAHSQSPNETSLIDTPLQPVELARLLQPTTRREREEAQMLAAHLQSERIMTRGDFWRHEHLRRLRILTTSRPATYTADQSVGADKKFGPDEEERLLEQFLLSRRQALQDFRSADLGRLRLGSDHSADSSENRPCVVCQSSQRTIIVWPCRCLCLCDDCRVSLAMNSFDKCVCCRRDVISFSRIFVP